jgi:MoaA/NifB/PqqE/SkfB family radical SAM enzyme
VLTPGSPLSLLAHKTGRLARQTLPVLQLGARRALKQKSPFQITFSLTNRCNFKCEYCDIPLQQREELGLAEWKAAIDEFRAGGMGRASLIGGEPLVHRDVGAIIAHLKGRGVHTAMNTNGWLVEEMIDVVSQLDLVCLTLDGPERVHDLQRRKGSYQKVIRALEVLAERGVSTVTMTVVTPSGADNVEHVLEVARRFGHKAFFQLEHDKSCDVMAPIAPRLSAPRIEAFVRHLMALKESGEPVGNSNTVLKAQLTKGRYLGTCKDCFAGLYYGYVLSDGTVAPCLLTQWQQEKGNGRRHGYLKAFNELRAPQGPGCSCVPTHEVNHVLGFDPAALWHAVQVSLNLPAAG